MIPAACSAPGCQGGHHRHGVVVRLQDDHVVLEQGVVTGDEAHDVPGRAPLPVHAVLEVGRGRRTRPLDRLPQQSAVRTAHPEPRQVEGHGEELLLAFEVDGRVGLDEDDGGGAEVCAVEPVVAGVEVEDDDGSRHVLAVELLELPPAAVDQGSVNAAVGQGRGAHQVGPQSVELHGRPSRDPQPPSLVDGHGDVVLVEGDVVQTDLPELAVHVQGRLLGAGIAGHARTEAREESHGLAQTVLRRQTAQGLEVDFGRRRGRREDGKQAEGPRAQTEKRADIGHDRVMIGKRHGPRNHRGRAGPAP